MIEYDVYGRRLTPATDSEMERLRKIEQARKKYDPGYISAEEAKTIPQELLDEDPLLASRLRSSADAWPENHLSASQVFRDVPGGSGESIETRVVEAASLFDGKAVGNSGGE